MADFTNDDPRMFAALAVIRKVPAHPTGGPQPDLGMQLHHDVLVDAVVAVARALDVQPTETFDVEFTTDGTFVARPTGGGNAVVEIKPGQDTAEAAADYRRAADALDAVAVEVASRGPVTRAADSLTAYAATLPVGTADRRLVLRQVDTIRAAIGDTLEL